MTYAPASEALSELKRTVASLRATADGLSASDTVGVRALAERITQALIVVDGVEEISKGSAAAAVRAKDMKTAREISVLIARKKRVVKELNELGDRVDVLAQGDGGGDGEELEDVREGVEAIDLRDAAVVEEIVDEETG